MRVEYTDFYIRTLETSISFDMHVILPPTQNTNVAVLSELSAIDYLTELSFYASINLASVYYKILECYLL